MTRLEHIEYWVKSADHDLLTADALLTAGRNDACLFFGHLMLEKMIKAVWVRDHEEGAIPPRIHNLLKIVSETKLQVSDEDKTFLGLVNDFNLEGRYPDYRFEFYLKCTPEFTKSNYARIREIFQCFRKQTQ